MNLFIIQLQFNNLRLHYIVVTTLYLNYFNKNSLIISTLFATKIKQFRFFVQMILIKTQLVCCINRCTQHFYSRCSQRLYRLLTLNS